MAGVSTGLFQLTGAALGQPGLPLGGACDKLAIDGVSIVCVLCSLHVDVIRLDHFRGFAAAWHVPAGAPTAQSGQWVPGPGGDFFNAVKKELGATTVHR